MSDQRAERLLVRTGGGDDAELHRGQHGDIDEPDPGRLTHCPHGVTALTAST
jgi:hypothetical protein